jgi:hypothetical protein
VQRIKRRLSRFTIVFEKACRVQDGICQPRSPWPVK